jgi:hypothetical protein
MAERCQAGILHTALRRGAALLAGLVIAGGGAIVFNSSPASAATTTDSIYVYNYPTETVTPLPAGTPDLATELENALVAGCESVDQSLLIPVSELVGGLGVPYSVLQILQGQGAVLVCATPYPHPAGLFVVGTGSVGVLVPNGGPFNNSECGVAVYDFPGAHGTTTFVGLAPPGDCVS